MVQRLPKNTQIKLLSMLKVLKKVKILLKPGQKATSHRQEAKHVLLRTGQMWPGSGQKAMQIRTA